MDDWGYFTPFKWSCYPTCNWFLDVFGPALQGKSLQATLMLVIARSDQRLWMILGWGVKKNCLNDAWGLFDETDWLVVWTRLKIY